MQNKNQTIIKFILSLFIIITNVFANDTIYTPWQLQKIDSLEKLLPEASKVEKIFIYNELAKKHLITNNYKALSYSEQAYSLAEKYDPDKLLIPIFTTMRVYYYLENYEKFFSYNTKALRIAEQQGKDSVMAKIYYNRSNVLLKLKIKEKAIEELNKSHDYAVKVKDSLILMLVYAAKGNLFLEEKSLEKALKYTEKSLLLAKRFKLETDIVYGLEAIGNINFEKEKYQSAINSFTKAVDVLEKSVKGSHSHNAMTKSRLLYKIAQVNLKMFDSETALKNYSLSINLAKKNSLNDNLVLCYHDLYKYYDEKQDKLNAYTYLKLFYSSNQKIIKEGHRKNVKILKSNYKLESKFESIKKEKEINDIKLKNRRFLNYLFVGLTVLLLVLLVLLLRQLKLQRTLYQIGKQKMLIEEDKNEEKEKRFLAEKRLKEEENLRLKEIQWQTDERLLFNERELSSLTLYITTKNEILSNINSQIEAILPSMSKEGNKLALRKIKKTINENIDLDNDWNTFKKHFENVSPRFFVKLLKDFPELSTNDLRLCAYIKMQLKNKEISRMQNITYNSVKLAKNRLKKKLYLSPDDELSTMIYKY